jgi:putative FmdB family regulatory protein
MPTYDYVCDSCGHKFEEFQSFTADLLKDCPVCHKPTLRRLFGTGAAILFKGSGFYETDYRSDSYKNSAKSDAEAGKPATSTTPASGTPAPGTPTKTDSGSSSTNSAGSS